MKNYILYEHVNKENGKKYIGITNNPLIRWRNKGIGYKPYKGSISKFWNAIEKYGWDNFEHNILLEGLTFEEACSKEKEEISKYDIRKELYNIAQGGNGGIIYLEHPKGMKGKKHSLEYKMELSKRMSKENNPFYGKKWEEFGGHPKGMKGKKHTDENKKKISNTMKRKGVNKKKVKCVYDNGEELVFNSVTECAEYFNTSPSGLLYRLLKSGEPYTIKNKNGSTDKIKIPVGTRFYKLS